MDLLLSFAVRRFRLLCATLIVICAGTAAAGTLPSDAAIRRILTERIGDAKGVGIVVGIVEPRGRRIVAAGGDGRAFDGDTVFEIGSVTKVFTALLLADMVQRKEVALTDPVAKYLRDSMRIPERNGRAIALVDLATHTSSLPFMADGAIAPFLARHELATDIGTTWNYSNLGYNLLAEALTARAGVDYSSLLRSRILGPLKLTSTAIVASPAMTSRQAIGRDASLQPAPSISSAPLYADLAAAGGLMSTANDLSAFLATCMGQRRSPLAPAMASMLETRRPKDANVEQALGWLVRNDEEGALIFHDGGTFGFASAVAWDPKRRTSVIVLMNQVGDVGDIAHHLLRPNVPLRKTTNAKHTEIALDVATLDLYAGKYEAAGEGVFTIVRDGNALTIESPADWGLPLLRLRPESSRAFFATELPLSVTFEVDDRVTTMVILTPRGNLVRATRRDE